ncbi:MAG: hypothetical protein M1823_006113 [Watsoniomyces obsoletus]|nr:MAG: hypothetical protein M1823_006113 [Watsoniomyces obsoletus]
MGSHSCIALQNLNPGGRGITPPPEGVEANFDNPESHFEELLAANMVCLSVAGAFVAMRLYTKYRFAARKLGPDDVTVIISMILSIGFSITSVIASRRGWGIHCWDFEKSLKMAYLQSEIALTSQYHVLIFFVKASILLLYIRIFDSSRFVKYSVWALFVPLAGFTIPSFFLSIFACRPVYAYWRGGPAKCVNTLVLGYVGAVVSIFTDIAIFVLPLPSIWRMHLPLRQRLQVIAVLATGLFACAVSGVRILAFADLAKQFDVTWHTYSPLLWTVVEVNVGIVCSCMPTLKPLLRAHMPGIFGGASTQDSGPSSFLQTPSSGYSKPVKQQPNEVTDPDDMPLYFNGQLLDNQIEMGISRQPVDISRRPTVSSGSATPPSSQSGPPKYPFTMI